LLRLAPTLTEYKRIALDWEDSSYCESEPSYIAIAAANELKGIGVPPEFIDSSPREVIILDESSSESKTKVATNTRPSVLSLIVLSSFINPRGIYAWSTDSNSSDSGTDVSDTSDTSQPAHGDSESRTDSSFVLLKRPTERITVVRYGGHSLGVEMLSISCDGSGAVRVKAKATEPKVKKSGMTGRSRNGGDDVQ